MLMVWLLLVVAVIVWLTARVGVHAFLALLLGAIAMGFLAGLDAATVLGAIGEGFGGTLQAIGIVIAAGAIIGEYLHRSGGAKVLADTILRRVGEQRSPLSMSLTGYIVSIPVFCDSGFIVLSTLNRAISRRTGVSLAVLGVALSTGLYATHVFVPPTPGPLAAAAEIGADLGWVLMLGLIVSLPAAGAALAWAVFFCRRYRVAFEPDVEEPPVEAAPSFAIAIAPIVVPIVLIALKSVADYPTQPLGEGYLAATLTFVGNPVIALLIGVGLAFLMINGSGEGRVRHAWLEEALKKAGVIILITGAGGAFGAVLRATELEQLAAGFADDMGRFGLLLPFLVAAFLKSAQGSSTVAIITTAAICGSLVEPLGFDSTVGRALFVLAIGAGSLTISHVNDSYFWVVAKFSNMDTATALKTHTVATLIMGVTALLTLQIMAWLLV